MRLNRQRKRAEGVEGAEGDTTPVQLVAAATEVFAAAGYRGATVRDICRQAGANVAAVNYHFGGKEGLYAEVLRCGLRRALVRFPPDGGVPAGATAEERLRGFVRSFLERMVSTGPEASQGRLLMREMVDPTPALDTVVAHELRALMGQLEAMVREVLGPDEGDEDVALGVASIVGQVAFYHHCRAVIPAAFPELHRASTDVARLTEHIVRFSLGGLEAMKRGSVPRKGRRAERVKSDQSESTTRVKGRDGQ